MTVLTDGDGSYSRLGECAPRACVTLIGCFNSRTFEPASALGESRDSPLSDFPEALPASGIFDDPPRCQANGIESGGCLVGVHSIVSSRRGYSSTGRGANASQFGGVFVPARRSDR